MRLCDLMAVLGRSLSTSTASPSGCGVLEGVERVSSPLDVTVALWDFDVRKPAGRLRVDGESCPLRFSSATTALKDDDSGDT